MCSYRTRKCPKCGSRNVAEILYGLPDFSDSRLQADLKSGKIVCGGCCIPPDAPKYRCHECGCEFGKGFQLMILEVSANAIKNST